jgi:hypothetical protein
MKQGTSRDTLIAVCLMLVSLVYSSTLKMEATFYFEALVAFQRPARRYVQEDKTPLYARFESVIVLLIGGLL